MTPIDLVLEQLAAFGHPAKKVGNSWIARCPSAPWTRHPSLSINEGKRQTTPILHCYAGCPIEAVLDRCQP
jgi:hypothetical protein